MNKLFAVALLFASSLSYGHKVDLVNEDGYMPLVIEPRIVFYITKEYTDNQIAPKGTKGLFIVTVDCERKLHRRALTEIYDPVSNTSKAMFKSNGDIADYMRGQQFIAMEPEIVPFANQLCSTLIKK